jgi:hypothetical protein
MFVRPMYLLFLPFVPVVVWLEDGRLGPVARRGLLCGLGCMLTLSPWSIYASLKAGTPMLLSANGGETLAGGLNPVIATSHVEYVAPDGRRTWGGPGKWLNEFENGYLSQAERSLPRPLRDKLLKERTVRWILADPMTAAFLQGAKWAYMWGVYPIWNGAIQTLLGNVPTLLALIASMLALVRRRRQWRQLVVLWILPVFVSAVAFVSWGSWRFRQPADVGLIALSVLLFWGWRRPEQPALRGRAAGAGDGAAVSPS